MAKKILRLTERDLTKLVRRVIKEQEIERELGMGEHGYEDSVKEFNDYMVLVDNGDSITVQKVINSLPKSVRFVAIINCESADFSDVNLCEYSDLLVMNIKGTPNNFEETQEECYESRGNGMYDYKDNMKRYNMKYHNR